MEDVRLISLMKDQAAIEVETPAGGRFTIESLGNDFDAGPDSFVDCAAAMESLDLVVTSDTAIAHLAGALGRPVFLALKRVPDWRWLMRREDCPWYPSMRLFRQAEKGDWGSVLSDRIEHCASNGKSWPVDKRTTRNDGDHNPRSGWRAHRQDHDLGDQGKAHRGSSEARKYPA
jgi:hypothetical protein